MRADPTTRRRGIRPLAAVIAAATVMLLAGCDFLAPTGDEAATSASPSISVSPSTSPSPSTPTVAVPTDCAAIVSPDVYAATFGSTPLNDPAVAGDLGLGQVTPSAPAADASAADVLDAATQLRCIWRDPAADITSIRVSIGTVNPVSARSYLDVIGSAGYTCTDVNDGRSCQLVRTEPQYGVPWGTTYFLRDDIFIVVDQINFPTDNLLGSIADTLWA